MKLQQSDFEKVGKTEEFFNKNRISLRYYESEIAADEVEVFEVISNVTGYQVRLFVPKQLYKNKRQYRKLVSRMITENIFRLHPFIV